MPGIQLSPNAYCNSSYWVSFLLVEKTHMDVQLAVLRTVLLSQIRKKSSIYDWSRVFFIPIWPMPVNALDTYSDSFFVPYLSSFFLHFFFSSLFSINQLISQVSPIKVVLPSNALLYLAARVYAAQQIFMELMKSLSLIMMLTLFHFPNHQPLAGGR